MNSIKEISSSFGLYVKLRLDALQDWAHVLERVSYFPVMYRNRSVEFQMAYKRWHGGEWHDNSLVIYWDSKPVAVWPLSYMSKDGDFKITSQGLPVLPPLYVNSFSRISCKRINKICFDILESLAINLGVSSWDSEESFNSSKGFSDWHMEAMARKSTCLVRHDLFIDLSMNLGLIKQNFRKSYKSLITSGMKKWSVKVLNVPDELTWNKFKDLH